MKNNHHWQWAITLSSSVALCGALAAAQSPTSSTPDSRANVVDRGFGHGNGLSAARGRVEHELEQQRYEQRVGEQLWCRRRQLRLEEREDGQRLGVEHELWFGRVHLELRYHRMVGGRFSRHRVRARRARARPARARRVRGLRPRAPRRVSEGSSSTAGRGGSMSGRRRVGPPPVGRQLGQPVAARRSPGDGHRPLRWCERFVDEQFVIAERCELLVGCGFQQRRFDGCGFDRCRFDRCGFDGLERVGFGRDRVDRFERQRLRFDERRVARRHADGYPGQHNLGDLHRQLAPTHDALTGRRLGTAP